MEVHSNSEIPGPELSVMYQNITEVVNLKCFQCHEKLKDFLKTLLKQHLKHQPRITEPSVPVQIPKETPQSQKVTEKTEPIPGHDQDSQSPVKKAQSPSSSSSLSTQSAKPSIDEILQLTDSSNPEGDKICKRTSQIFNKVKQNFLDFSRKESGLEFQELLKDKTKLEDMIMQYFYTMRVNRTSQSTGQLPKKSSLEQNKSFIKKMISQESKNQLDLSNPEDFPRFIKFYKTYTKKIESEAPANYVQFMPEQDLRQVYTFLIYMHSIMDGTCQDLSRIPIGYEYKFHYLALRGAIFVLLHHISKKSRSQIDKFKVNDFQVIIDPMLGKVLQNIQTGEYIPFCFNHYGLNCGQYLQDFISKLDPNCPWLLCRPLRESKAVQESLPRLPTWFENTKIGRNNDDIVEFVQALGLPKYTNCQVPYLKLPALGDFDSTDYYEDEDSYDPLTEEQPPDKMIKVEQDVQELEQAEPMNPPHYVYLRDNSMH